MTQFQPVGIARVKVAAVKVVARRIIKQANAGERVVAVRPHKRRPPARKIKTTPNGVLKLAVDATLAVKLASLCDAALLITKLADSEIIPIHAKHDPVEDSRLVGDAGGYHHPSTVCLSCGTAMAHGTHCPKCKKTDKTAKAKDPSFDPKHPDECCPHCGARQERGDDGACNRCRKPWPQKSALAKLAALSSACDAMVKRADAQRIKTAAVRVIARRMVKNAGWGTAITRALDVAGNTFVRGTNRVVNTLTHTAKPFAQVTEHMAPVAARVAEPIAADAAHVLPGAVETVRAGITPVEQAAQTVAKPVEQVAQAAKPVAGGRAWLPQNVLKDRLGQTLAGAAWGGAYGGVTDPGNPQHDFWHAAGNVGLGSLVGAGLGSYGGKLMQRFPWQSRMPLQAALGGAYGYGAGDRFEHPGTGAAIGAGLGFLGPAARHIPGVRNIKPVVNALEGVGGFFEGGTFGGRGIVGSPHSVVSSVANSAIEGPDLWQAARGTGRYAGATPWQRITGAVAGPVEHGETLSTNVGRRVGQAAGVGAAAYAGGDLLASNRGSRERENVQQDIAAGAPPLVQRMIADHFSKERDIRRGMIAGELSPAEGEQRLAMQREHLGRMQLCALEAKGSPAMNALAKTSPEIGESLAALPTVHAAYALKAQQGVISSEQANAAIAKTTEAAFQPVKNLLQQAGKAQEVMANPSKLLENMTDEQLKPFVDRAMKLAVGGGAAGGFGGINAAADGVLQKLFNVAPGTFSGSTKIMALLGGLTMLGGLLGGNTTMGGIGGLLMAVGVIGPLLGFDLGKMLGLDDMISGMFGGQNKPAAPQKQAPVPQTPGQLSAAAQVPHVQTQIAGDAQAPQLSFRQDPADGPLYGSNGVPLTE